MPALDAAITRLRAFGAQQELRVIEAGKGGTVQTVRPPNAEAVHIVVRRKRFGTIPLDDLPHIQWEGYPSGAWAAVPTLALYWCDGHRTLADVIELTRMELGATEFDFVGYFKFLERRGYVEFAK